MLLLVITFYINCHIVETRFIGMRIRHVLSKSESLKTRNKVFFLFYHVFFYISFYINFGMYISLRKGGGTFFLIVQGPRVLVRPCSVAVIVTF